MKQKEKSRLVLQWRKPEETNGVIKKYLLYFSDNDGVTKTYTLHSDVDKEYVTYKVTLPDVETEYKIKVSEKRISYISSYWQTLRVYVRFFIHAVH